MFSAVGWREGTAWQNCNPFSFSPLSKDCAFSVVVVVGGVGGETEKEPYGIALFKIPIQFDSGLLSATSRVSAHCSHVTSYGLWVPVRKSSSRTFSSSINWHRQKSHGEHMENSSKVWQKTYKWGPVRTATYEWRHWQGCVCVCAELEASWSRTLALVKNQCPVQEASRVFKASCHIYSKVYI